MLGVLPFKRVSEVSRDSSRYTNVKNLPARDFDGRTSVDLIDDNLTTTVFTHYDQLNMSVNSTDVTPTTIVPLDLIRLAVSAMRAKRSKQAYTLYLTKLLSDISSISEFNRAFVMDYIEKRQQAGASAATCNLIRFAAKRLAVELRFAGIINSEQSTGIVDIRATPKRPVRSGRWLTIAQVDQLMNSPDTKTRKGLRDRALLGLLLGCGLRRDELANLRWRHLQTRDERDVLTDFRGKGDKVRIVVIPRAVLRNLVEWKASLIRMSPEVNADTFMFPPFSRGDWVRDLEKPMSNEAVFYTIRQYAQAIGVVISPHDLRRTYAQLARKAGADLDQIKYSLGHADIGTTERYIGHIQDFRQGRAPCDLLDCKWGETAE